MSDTAVVPAPQNAGVPGAPPDLAVDQFRMMFPEFSDPVKWPDTYIAFYIDLAPLDPDVWGEFYNYGQGLWAAHEMKMFGPADGSGGLATNGPISSKGVGPVSVSYDTNLGAEDGAGFYNKSGYGQKFIHYARLLGMGPIQVGSVTPSPYGQGPWLGPPPYPGWFG